MKILLIGMGVVGRSFVRLLAERGGDLYRRHGLAARLVGVVDRGGTAVSERGLNLADVLATKDRDGTIASMGQKGGDAERLIEDTDADVVIEATPTDVRKPQAAMSRMKCAMRHGRHVISVNKGPLATAMPALVELANYNRVEFRFSGTVGGGTPMLAAAREAARGDEIVGIRAILNGTTNFILSRMHDSDESFDAALAEAIKLGYAETDPSADIDGVDTATKVVILANWVLGRSATLSDVSIAGIRGMADARIRDAAAAGKRVKLIGRIDEKGICVQPDEIPAGGPMDVSGSLNAMCVTLKTAGDVTLVGRGAGGPETAVAIARDLLDIWHVVHEK